MADTESHQLCDEVEGWPTALQLIALSVRQSTTTAQESARRLAKINASHLSDYLVDEVLDRVDATTRNFLLRCSVLRSMNDVLLTRLTGEDNGQQQLEELERQGLFIHRMDADGEWFCFHPLFANFYVSAANGNWQQICPIFIVERRRVGSIRAFPPRQSIMH